MLSAAVPAATTPKGSWPWVWRCPCGTYTQGGSSGLAAHAATVHADLGDLAVHQMVDDATVVKTVAEWAAQTNGRYV